MSDEIKDNDTLEETNANSTDNTSKSPSPPHTPYSVKTTTYRQWAVTKP